MGFINDVRRVITGIPRNRQTLFFSATMPPEIRKLSEQILTHPVRIEVTPVASTAEKIDQAVYLVEKRQKTPLLIHLLDELNVNRGLVFTRTKRDANRVAEQLNGAGIRSEAIHGNKSQGARERALESIKKGECRVLVATDIAARGIDIDKVTHVFNHDIPNVSESYVHRIGRTARAGSEGSAFSFCASEERAFWVDIERLIRKKITVLPLPDGLGVEGKSRSRPPRGKPSRSVHPLRAGQAQRAGSSEGSSQPQRSSAGAGMGAIVRGGHPAAANPPASPNNRRKRRRSTQSDGGASR